MKREVSTVEKEGDCLYVSYDKVKYFEKDESNSVYEEMIEIEYWKNPNTIDVNYDYNRHFIEINNSISNAQLLIELTKDSKYFRGYTILNYKEMYREQESLLSNIEDNFKKQYEKENKRDFTCEVDDGIEDYDNKGYYYDIINGKIK